MNEQQVIRMYKKLKSIRAVGVTLQIDPKKVSYILAQNNVKKSKPGDAFRHPL